jgi:hypothetical protein
VSGSVGFFIDPPPPIVDDVNLGNHIRGTTIAHQFVASAGEEPITWGNLVVNGPGAPSNAPILTAGGAFSWNSAGTDPLGIYTFDVTATNPLGSSVGRLTVNLDRKPDRPGDDDPIGSRRRSDADPQPLISEFS